MLTFLGKKQIQNYDLLFYRNKKETKAKNYEKRPKVKECTVKVEELQEKKIQ